MKRLAWICRNRYLSGAIREREPIHLPTDWRANCLAFERANALGRTVGKRFHSRPSDDPSGNASTGLEPAATETYFRKNFHRRRFGAIGKRQIDGDSGLKIRSSSFLQNWRRGTALRGNFYPHKP